jgi:hypothetical protein
VPERPIATDAQLYRHAASAGRAATSIAVSVAWSPGQRELALHYRLDGDMQRLLLPAAAAPARADGLWQHSCFEAFLRPAAADGYCEFNFSPSGQWAAYRFTGRREGMQPLAPLEPPTIRLDRRDEGLDLHVTMSLAPVPGAAGDRPLELGLAAIVEDRDGALAWWALRHPAGRPDFHDPGSFALRLEPAASVPA